MERSKGHCEMATKVISTPLDQKTSWWERIYLKEIGRGLVITISHFIRNMLDLRRDKVGLTYQWPEQPKPLPERWRGEHRLMQREDGTPRCVGCMMCETICPARCIYIVAEEHPDPNIEKRPVSFDIDLGMCVYCGFCVEVCPEDAIRMDTQILDVCAYSRAGLKLNMAQLLAAEPGMDFSGGAPRD